MLDVRANGVLEGGIAAAGAVVRHQHSLGNDSNVRRGQVNAAELSSGLHHGHTLALILTPSR